jgi:hypothetical protein
MTGRPIILTTVKCLIPVAIACGAFAQSGPADPNYIPQDHRPPLAFREDFKAPPKGVQEVPVTQNYIANPALELKVYGPGGMHVQVDHHDPEPKDDPNFLWTGITPGPWAVALKDKQNFIDLSGLGKIRWRTEQTGLHQLHPIVKLSDGTWLVGEYAEGWTPDWRESEFWPSYIRWHKLDIVKVAEMATGTRWENGRWEEHPDLSKVDEIGFTDLMGGSGHGQGGWSRIDWIEVYGNPVKRESAAPARTGSTGGNQ